MEIPSLGTKNSYFQITDGNLESLLPKAFGVDFAQGNKALNFSD